MLKILNILNGKGGGAPTPPPPTPPPAPPTVDNSEEVARQRRIEQERQKRSGGLGATDLTEGEGVALDEENIDEKKAVGTTLLGEEESQ